MSHGIDSGRAGRSNHRLRSSVVVLVVAIGWATPAIAAAEEQVWVLQAEKSELSIQVFRDNDSLLSGLSHDHVVQARGWKGEARVTGELPTGCSGEIEVPVAELVVDDPEQRRRLQWPPIEDEDRAKIREQMLGESQLDAHRFPTIAFSLDGCEASDTKGEWKLRGTFRLHGRAKRLELTAKVEIGAEGLRVRGSVPLRHTEFGIEPYSAALGGLRNRDRMLLVFDLVGRPGS